MDALTLLERPRSEFGEGDGKGRQNNGDVDVRAKQKQGKGQRCWCACERGRRHWRSGRRQGLEGDTKCGTEGQREGERHLDAGPLRRRQGGARHLWAVPGLEDVSETTCMNDTTRITKQWNLEYTSTHATRRREGVGAQCKRL